MGLVGQPIRCVGAVDRGHVCHGGLDPTWHPAQRCAVPIPGLAFGPGLARLLDRSKNPVDRSPGPNQFGRDHFVLGCGRHHAVVGAVVVPAGVGLGLGPRRLFASVHGRGCGAGRLVGRSLGALAPGPAGVGVGCGVGPDVAAHERGPSLAFGPGGDAVGGRHQRLVCGAHECLVATPGHQLAQCRPIHCCAKRQ